MQAAHTRARIRACALVAAVLITGFGLWSRDLLAQTETGQITGTVTDPTGAGIPNAAVKIVSASTGAVRNTNASGIGEYTVTNLLPGDYTVTASATGFNPAEQRVTLTVGAKVGQNFQLQVGSATTVVEVNAQPAQVNTETQTQSEVITQREIREIGRAHV